MPTLDEVARLSGVSRATASRALTGDAKVKDETRKRVKAVAESLGYRPNRAARSLASGKSGVIGLVLPTLLLSDDPYGALLIHGLSDAASRRDLGLMLWLTHQEPGSTVREIFSGGIVDGLVVSATALNHRWVEPILDGGIPSVLLGRHPSRPDVHHLRVDNLAGARLVVEHLVSLGHKKIVTITGPLDRVDAVERLQAYRDAMEENGLTVTDDMISESNYTPDGGLAAMARLLPLKPTAVFCGNDQMAFGATEAIRLAGLDVPTDISIVGFDDFPDARSFRPPLTTVGQDIALLSQRAVDRLAELIADPSLPPEDVILPAKFSIRRSTGAPPSQ